MDYITVKEASANWGISTTRVTVLAAQGRIDGARKVGTSWLLPANSKKPDDRRVRNKETVPSPETEDNFSFPLFPYRPDMSAEFTATLSLQEHLLLEAQTALLNCRFQDTEKHLDNLLRMPCNVSIRIAALATQALYFVAQGHPADFLAVYNRIQQILSEDFSHKEDLRLCLKNIELYTLPLSQAKENILLPEEMHPQCIPTLCAYNGYVLLSKEVFQIGSVDVNTLELNLRLLENTSAVLAVEQLHFDLMGIYALRMQTEMMNRHAVALIKLVYESRHYYPLAIYMQFFDHILQPVLETFTADFVEEFQSANKTFSQNYIKFLSSFSQESIFPLLTGKYVSYIREVLIDSTNKDIAAHLDVSEQTVARKLSELYEALHVESKKELREYIIRNL